MNKLDIWTVFDHPRDFPESYVARMSTSPDFVPTDLYLTAETLEALRDLLQEQTPYVLTCLPRHPTDDPVIVECWL